jgi:hypothetical protein
LWGSQSWLPPAFSRRLPGAKTPDRGKSRLKEAAEKVREEHFEPSINADERQ